MLVESKIAKLQSKKQNNRAEYLLETYTEHKRKTKRKEPSYRGVTDDERASIYELAKCQIRLHKQKSKDDTKVKMILDSHEHHGLLQLLKYLPRRMFQARQLDNGNFFFFFICLLTCTIK